MDKSINDLREEVVTERKEIYDKALEAFCKDELARMMDIVNDAERRLMEVSAKKNAMTIKSLKDEFDNGFSQTSMKNIKGEYMERIKNG